MNRVLLWQPAPFTDPLVAALGEHDGPPVRRCSVTDLPDRLDRPSGASGGARGVLRRLGARGRTADAQVWCVRLGHGASGAAANVDDLGARLAGMSSSARIVAVVPPPDRHVESAYHAHVLRGGTETLAELLDRGTLEGEVRADREALARLAGDGRIVVATAGGADDLDRLTAALGLEAPRPATPPSSAPGRAHLTARGLEVLRRLNGFAADRRERRSMLRYCRQTFPAGQPADAAAILTDEQRRALLTRFSD